MGEKVLVGAHVFVGAHVSVGAKVVVGLTVGLWEGLWVGLWVGLGLSSWHVSPHTRLSFTSFPFLGPLRIKTFLWQSFFLITLFL